MSKFLILSIYFFIFGNWLLSFTSLDEGRNMTAVYNMLTTGDYISPVYNCQPRFEKPPMLYWLIALSSSIFGLNEFSARLISGIAAIGIAYVTYLIAKNFFSEETAKKSFLVFFTLPHLWIESRAVVPEMINTFFMILSFFLFLREKFILGWISLAFAFLSKGPVGVILVIGTYLIFKRDLKILNLKAIMIFLILGSSWYILMIIQHGYDYFYRFFIYENVMRYTGHRLTHPAPIYYYLLLVIATTIFYIPIYPRLIKGFNKQWTNFLLWFILVIVFFSLAKNKLHHYILFAYPPMAILLANFASEKYLKYIVSICAILLFIFLAFVYIYEKERLIPKSYQIVKEYKGKVSFYKAEDSAMVFYSRRCIEKINNPDDAQGLIITHEKYIKDLSCTQLLKGREFDRIYYLVECN